MADPLNTPTSADAQAYLEKARSLKQQGQLDAALTEYRRAALVDPTLVEAQLGIGYLCRDKSKGDPLFQRTSFEAFQKAARLDLKNEEAHNQYMMASQKQGRLDDLILEYDAWLKTDPENELLLKCKKNILTISMASMPDKVNLGGAGLQAPLKKFLLFTSVGSAFLGVVLMASPLMLRKTATVISPDISLGAPSMSAPAPTPNATDKQGKKLLWGGLVLEVLAATGFVVRARLR